MSDLQHSTSVDIVEAIKRFRKWYYSNTPKIYSTYEDGDGIVVTENEPRASRPDNTNEEALAESRTQQVIKDLDAGLVSRRSAEKVRSSADRVVKGSDLSRGIRRI